MKRYILIVTFAFITFSVLVSADTKPARQSPVTRTVLQQHDISTPGHEAVQAIIGFEPGASVGNHSHPGEEIIFILEGVLKYQVAGKPSVTLKAGGVLFIPAGTIHSAKNISSLPAKELATYIVKKGKPIIINH
jgi:quercetin dioxygenase-like cupin family protein